MIHLHLDSDVGARDAVTAAIEKTGRHVVDVGEGDLGARLPEIEILFAGNPLRIDWSQAKRLRFLQLMGSGVDALWPATGLREDVVIANARGIHLPEMRDHALALMLALERELPRFAAQQRDREWKPVATGTLAGKTVAIVGLGEVGRSLAAACAALGMRVVGACRTPRAMPHVQAVFSPEDMREMLASADHLVVTVPLTPRTRSLLDERAFAAMKPGAFLIHLSRGAVVDADALEAALRRGHLRGAAVDVFADEPLPRESSLWTTPNLVITPHVAGVVHDYLERATQLFLENLARIERGEPPRTLVDRQQQY